MADNTFDLEKYRSIAVNTRGPSTRVREFKKDDGERIKKTMDELGNVVTEHAKNDRQDVHINAQTVTTVAAGT